MSTIPNVGYTADDTAPRDLPLPAAPPPNFPVLGDIDAGFIAVGGDFLIVEEDRHLVGMGGIRPNTPQQAEVLHVRVHPASRRRGVGHMLMTALERRARELAFSELHLDTATNQPEALAFYTALGYEEEGRERRPEWHWTLVYFTKALA